MTKFRHNTQARHDVLQLTLSLSRLQKMITCIADDKLIVIGLLPATKLKEREHKERIQAQALKTLVSCGEEILS